MLFGKVGKRAFDMAGAMMPQIDPETQGAINSYAAMPMEKPRGLFGRIFGGDFAGKMGGLASGLAKAQAYMDGDWGAAQSIVDPRQAALAAQAQRQAQFDDWRTKYEYERANPKTTAQPHRWEANDGSLMELGPDGQARVVYKDPTPKLNWIRADNGDGTFSLVPVGPNGPITGSTAPAAPVGRLTPITGGTGVSVGGRFRP